MKKMIFVYLMIYSKFAFSFDTEQGKYIGQQDALQLLNDIFFANQQPVNYGELTSCILYENSINDGRKKNLYELGFNNILNGAPIVSNPDVAYVLFFENCIGKIINSNNYFKVELFINSTGTEQISPTTLTKNIPNEILENVISDIFLKVFRSKNLIPMDYFNESKNELINDALTENISFKDFIIKVYKNAIINDYLLKY